MSTTLIKGGTVVTASGTLDADVLVTGEKIAAVLARDVTGGQTAPAADQVIDATGKYVLPGGIDVHTHMEMPFGGTFSADTFETGTRAAAWGGTTTIIDFAVQAKGTSLLATLDKWHEKADGNCAVDYGFHMIVSDVNDATLKEMESCIGAGSLSDAWLIVRRIFTAAWQPSMSRQLKRAKRKASKLRLSTCERTKPLDFALVVACSRPPKCWLPI